MTDWEKTHLCGSMYSDKKCENFVYATEPDMKIGKKVLQRYYVYCTAEGRCRSMGCAASWTGCSPKWCPKRQAMEGVRKERQK